MSKQRSTGNLGPGTRHTPGPWIYEPSSQMRYSYLILTADFDEDAGKGLVLARTSDNISEADARLIAAAPDYYDAAEEIRKLVVAADSASSPFDDTRDITLPTQLIRALLDAHKKADPIGYQGGAA